MIPLKSDRTIKKIPVATLFLVSINTVIFFYQATHYNYHFLRDNLALIPFKVLFSHKPHYYLTLLTYMFLHASLLHLVANMLYLWIFGASVEDFLGHLGFIYYYILCGIGAGAIHMIANPSSLIPTVGASGAISGLLAAYMILFPSARIVVLVPIFIFFEVIKVPAYLFIGLWFIYQFLAGFSSLAGDSPLSGIAWFAHIGGFIFGILLLPVFILVRKIVGAK
jgi:membrane associated rhomboid family serine protease